VQRTTPEQESYTPHTTKKSTGGHWSNFLFRASCFNIFIIASCNYLGVVIKVWREELRFHDRTREHLQDGRPSSIQPFFRDTGGLAFLLAADQRRECV
jgi:hypothetical protein